MTEKNVPYLEGLNSLRFFAAFLVIIYHAKGSLIDLGLLADKPVPILDKGVDAVDFFFTLSGFLITYLLLKENRQYNDISIRKFYLRRVLRIWPVYFLIVFFRFSLYGFIYPYIFHTSSTYADFPIVKGLFLYLFFLPNLAAIIYNVGLLHPLWSIGVEEQFYLLWAPLFKWFRKHTSLLIAAAIIGCTAWYLLVWYNVVGFNSITRDFLLTEKFYAMIIGAGFGYILFYLFDAYDRSFFAGRFFQLIVFSCLIYHFCLSDRLENNIWFNMLSPLLYGAFILNVSAVTKKLFSLEKAPFVFLGEISYGLYMYHSIISFFLKQAFQKWMVHHPTNHLVLIALYFTLLTGGTIILALLSYRYFETRFLQLKHRYSVAV